MSGRGYNKNMKSGDAAPRHPNTNNYQQSNSRQNANYHPMSSNNKTQGHNTLTNNPPHLQQPHVTHNLQNPMSHSHSINPLNTIIHPNYTSGRQQQINHARNQPMSNLRAPYNPTRPLNPQSYPFPVYNDPNLYYLPNMYPTQVPPGPYLLSQNFYGTGISPIPGPGMMQQMASTTAPISNQGRMQPSGPPAQPPTSMPNDVMTNQSIQIDANSMKIPSSQPQPTQLSHPQVPHTRKKNVARIQDPTTGEEKDLNEIAKLSIDQSANQNANSQVTVTNQVIVLENHNDQISNKNDEKPSQAITVEKKTVEQAPTQTNRNNQNQQEQLPKQQDAPVAVEQEKINKTDEKVVEHKKVEHKQPLLQNPVKPDIDNNVNNKRESSHFGRQQPRIANSNNNLNGNKRPSYSEKDHPFNSTASSTATFNRSIDSNGHSANSSFNASAINFPNNPINESIELNGSFNSFEKSRKRETRNFRHQKDFGRDRRDNNRKDRYQRRPSGNHDFNPNNPNEAFSRSNSVINNSSFHSNNHQNNHQNNQKLGRSISATSTSPTANTTSSSSNKSNQTINSNLSKFSYSDVLQNKSTLALDNKNESNEFSSENSQLDLNFSGHSEQAGDKTISSSDQSPKVDDASPESNELKPKNSEKAENNIKNTIQSTYQNVASQPTVNGLQSKTILSKTIESRKLSNSDKEPKINQKQLSSKTNLDQYSTNTSQASSHLADKDQHNVNAVKNPSNSNNVTKGREPYVAKSKNKQILNKKSKEVLKEVAKKVSVSDDKLDVNKETPKTPMINLEEKLDKLQINDSSVKPQDEKPQQQPEKSVVVNNKEEPRAPESKADKKIEQINTAPDKKPEEQQDKPPVQQQQQQQQQNVQKAQVNVQPSNQSEPQVKQNVPAVKPQQSAEVKKSNQVKAQSKSTEIISYDVEFLKKLQYSSFSIEKPNFGNLTQRVEILLNEPRRQDDSSNEFDPHYLRMNSNRNSVSHGHRSMQMGQRPGDKVPRKILATSLNDEVKLNKSENAWTQAFKGKKKAANFQETTEGLIARARGMLNKLTPQNFDKLSKDFCDLAIDTEDKLKKMIELIFDKAVDEPAFCEQYAMLCKIMSSISVKVSEDNKEKIIKFNTLLLERCQTCFEKDKYQDLNLDERLKKIAECDDKEKKQQLIDELDEEKRLVRKKSLGNIKLIGALYKNNRLKDEIMNLCIDTLINDNQEDSLECLCSLLKSIGEKYEKSNPKKAQFNNQMNKLEAIVRENKIASRIKFLIMDILDMRKENWKPRKLQEGNKPKKIEEVHEDIKKEEEQSNIQYSQLAKRGNDSMKKRNDNWMGSGSRKSQQSSNDAISNLRKLNEQRNNSPNLGPGGPTFTMGMSFGSWSQGASGAKSSLASTSQDKKINQWQQRNQTNDRSQQTPQPVKPKFRGNYTLSQDGDFDFIAQLSDFLKSYIKSSQIDGLINSIYDNCTEDSVHLFVVAAIDCACESLLKNIDQVGELLANLVIKERVISYSQFHKGLKHHLDQSEDIVTDVPKFHEYIGQILSHFYNKLPDNERRSFFKEALQPCIPLNTSLLMVIHMIKYLTRADLCQDTSEIAKKWVASNLDWSDFLKEDSEQYLKESLKKYDLSEFVVELNNCKLITNKSVETSNLVNQILTCKFDEVSKILEKNISSNDKELSKKLISAFIERCILDSTDFDNPSKSCDKNYTFNESKFESQIKSISLDLFNDEEYQLEVIYSACKVNHDRSNPKDLLFNLFNFFLTEINLVKKDTFVKWYKENSSRVGNGIAIMNMKRFIGNLIKLSDTNED